MFTKKKIIIRNNNDDDDGIKKTHRTRRVRRRRHTLTVLLDRIDDDGDLDTDARVDELKSLSTLGRQGYVPRNVGRTSTAAAAAVRTTRRRCGYNAIGPPVVGEFRACTPFPVTRTTRQSIPIETRRRSIFDCRPPLDTTRCRPFETCARVGLPPEYVE